MLYIDTNIYICIVYRYTHIDIYTYRYRVYRYTHTDILFLYQVLVSVYGIFKLCHAGSSSLTRDRTHFPPATLGERYLWNLRVV